MNRVLQSLGLAMRAGKVVSGEDQVLHTVRTGKAELVLLSLDAGENTKKKMMDKCHTYQVPILQYGTREELGKAIGKPVRVIVAVTDAGFARSIQKQIE